MAKLLFASAVLLLVALANADVVGIIDHFDNPFGEPCAEQSNHAFFVQDSVCWNGTTYTCSGNWSAPITVTNYANTDCTGAVTSTQSQDLCQRYPFFGSVHHTCSIQMPKFSNDMIVEYGYNSTQVVNGSCPAPINAVFAEAHRAGVCYQSGFQRNGHRWPQPVFSILTCAGTNGMINRTTCQDPNCQQGCVTRIYNSSCNYEGDFTTQIVAPMCSANPPAPIPITPGIFAVTQIYNNGSTSCENPNSDLPNSAVTYTSGACVRPDRNKYSQYAWGRINICQPGPNPDQGVEVHYFLDNYCTYESNMTTEMGCQVYNRTWPVTIVTKEFISCVDTTALVPLPFDTTQYFANFHESGYQCSSSQDQEGDYWLIEQCHQSNWGGYVQHQCQPNRVTTVIFNSSDCNPNSMVTSWWDPLDLCQYGGNDVTRVQAPKCALTTVPPPANQNTPQYIKTAYTSDSQCQVQSSHVEMRVAGQCQPLPNGFYFSWGQTPIYNSYSYLTKNATSVLEQQYLDPNCTQLFNVIAYPIGCDSAQLQNGMVYAMNSYETSLPDTSLVFAHMSYNSPTCNSAPSVINTFPANTCYFNGNAQGGGGFGARSNYSKIVCTGTSWTRYDCRDSQCNECFPRGNGQSGACMPGWINGTAQQITCPAASAVTSTSGSASSGPSGGMTGGGNYRDHYHTESAMVTVIIVLSVIFGVLALVLTFLGYRQGSRSGWTAV